MKKNIPIIAIGGILILGACVLLYPAVSAILAKATQTAAISTYQRTVDSLAGQEIEKMKADARKYNESLSGAVLSDPFSGGKDTGASCGKLLNVGEMIGYLEIPKIDVYLPVYHGTSEEILQKGIGHLKNTSLPIGGRSTHAVLSGHRGLPSATLFTNLDQLAKGDRFYIHVLNEILAYEVDQVKVVGPQDTSDLTIREGKDFVTLVTCTPYGINTQRLLVRGARTEYKAGEKQARPNSEPSGEVSVVPAAFLLAAVLPIVLLVGWKRRKKEAGK